MTVYYSQDGSISEQQQNGGLSFQVIPAAGGDPIAMSSAGGSISAEGTQRSEVIGEHGAIAKLDVPADGEYRIVAATDLQPGSASLDFGTNPATAVAAKWKLLAALVGAAFVIALIPTPRHRRRSPDDPETPGASGTPTDWSPRPSAPLTRARSSGRDRAQHPQQRAAARRPGQGAAQRSALIDPWRR